MNSETFPPIPLETAKAARAVFGGSNFYMATGDQANHLFDGLILEDPSRRIQVPARTLAMFYLITIFQYIETLPDHMAAGALHERLDWKYALHLPLNYPHLEASALCEFRKLFSVDRTGVQNFQTLLMHLSEVTRPAGKQFQNLQTYQVITRVCMFSRLAKIWETLNQALEALATRRPDWLLVTSLPHWYERYDQHRRNLNLRADSLEQHAMAQAIGADGFYLLEAVSKTGEPGLMDLVEILALRQVWREQFECVEGKASWRKEACAGCSLPDKLAHLIEGTNHNK